MQDSQVLGRIEELVDAEHVLLHHGMKCRIYRFDGGQSPTAPEAWIRAAPVSEGVS